MASWHSGESTGASVPRGNTSLFSAEFVLAGLAKSALITTVVEQLVHGFLTGLVQRGLLQEVIVALETFKKTLVFPHRCNVG